MIEVDVRAYGDLNDFLPRGRRQVEFRHRLPHQTSVKDLLEGLGMPHPEIAMILVGGSAVGFGGIVRRSCRVSAFPRFRDMFPDSTLQPPLPDEPGFVLDTHLGRLARYLRLLGFDTLYDNSADDNRLVQTAVNDGRILLSRDLGIMMHADVRLGYYVRATDPRQQVHEVVSRLQLAEGLRPFSRCLSCNGCLEAVAKEDVADQLKPLTRRHYYRFWKCKDCGRIYWEGSHFERLTELVDEVRRAAHTSHS